MKQINLTGRMRIRRNGKCPGLLSAWQSQEMDSPELAVLAVEGYVTPSVDTGARPTPGNCYETF